MNKVSLLGWLLLAVAIVGRLTRDGPAQDPISVWMRANGIEDFVIATLAGVFLVLVAVLGRIAFQAARNQKQLDELNMKIAQYQRTRRK